MSINKVILVGNLGSDPEMRTFQNGGAITTVNIATSERWTDKNTGERKEHTEWHRVVFSNRLAEIAAQYLKKGSKIYVEGSIRTRKWQDSQTGQDRYSTEIRATELQMLDSRSQGQNSGHGSPANAHGMVGSMNAGNNQNYNHLNNQPNTSYNKRPAQPQPMQPQSMQQGPGPINYPSHAIGTQNPNAVVISPTTPPGVLADDDIPF